MSRLKNSVVLGNIMCRARLRIVAKVTSFIVEANLRRSFLPGHLIN